jgi:predicted nucleic acid-binding protein
MSHAPGANSPPALSGEANRGPQNDTWIAACAIRHGIPLLTLNRRDFAAFAEHDALALLANERGDRESP